MCVIASAQPIRHAHSHNDYTRTHPLHDALRNGFTSIEIDVFLFRNKLVVSHIPLALSSKKTLDELYLKPLEKRITENSGYVYKGFETPLILTIDFKTGGTETYLAVQQALRPYHHLLTLYKNGKVVKQGALQILLSGSVPVSELLKEDTCLALVDLQIQRATDTTLWHIAGRYSSAWGKYFTWKGKGSMDAKEQEQLTALVQQVHALAKDIRFYHIPDKPAAWKQLLDAQVDWINTDKPTAFRKFYTKVYRR